MRNALSAARLNPEATGDKRDQRIVFFSLGSKAKRASIASWHAQSFIVGT